MGRKGVETLSSLEAKKKLSLLRASGDITLTPEIAQLILANNGPTFKAISGGYRCNQTGEKIGVGGTKKYRRRIWSLAKPPKK